MRNAALHHLLEAFTVEASGRLAAELASGAEMPFEVVEERGGTAALYCYQPLTKDFIFGRLEVLATLGSYLPAAEALADCEATDVYLTEHGVARVPGDPRMIAEAAIGTFLSAVYTDRSEFGFEPVQFEAAYRELERALYEGNCTATVIAPVLGVALDPETTQLALGDGLSLIRGDALGDAPPDAVWADGDEPNVLALLTVDHERSARPPISVARVRFRRDPDGAEAVRARWLRDRPGRLGAHRGGQLASGGDRLKRPAAAGDCRARRPGGRAPRVLRPDCAQAPGRRRAVMGVVAL